MRNKFIYYSLFLCLVFCQSNDDSIYIVKEGQTLTDIANELSLDANDIVDWNNLTNLKLTTGQKLNISEPTSSSLIDENLINKNLKSAKDIESEKENSSYLDQDFVEEDLSKEYEPVVAKKKSNNSKSNQPNDTIKKENPELAQTGELTTTQYIIAFAFLLIAFALDEAGVIDLGSDNDSDSD